MKVLGALKALFGGGGLTASRSTMPAQPVQHPVLGDLAPDKNFPDTLVGHIPVDSSLIKLSIAPDGESMEAAIALAVEVVGSMKALDARSRVLIAEDTLGSYNTTWRSGEVVLQNGTTEPFEKPVLSSAEFCEKLKFEAVEVTGSGMLIFWYGDDDMFCGHSLYVTSFDGVTMKDAHVSMFG